MGGVGGSQVEKKKERKCVITMAPKFNHWTHAENFEKNPIWAGLWLPALRNERWDIVIIGEKWEKGRCFA